MNPRSKRRVCAAEVKPVIYIQSTAITRGSQMLCFENINANRVYLTSLSS
jgi:hypothetical protein